MPSTLVLDRALARNVPESFGRFELLAQIGSGGMAEVFLARIGELAGLRSLVAVKRILPGCATDPSFGELFQREARIALRLHHRGIARVIEVGKVDGSWFLAMELVQGETVSRVQKAEAAANHPATPAMITYAGAELALALHHLHSLTDGRSKSLGIVHRDVSPQNVMLGFDGAVKLIDFGIARATSSRQVTQAGQFRGKLSYSAPEHVDGRAVDARTDVYALGVVLHEWLSGNRLFRRQSPTRIMEAILTETPPPLTGVASDLAFIVAKALEKDPERRFASAEAMAHALLETQSGQAGEGPKAIGAHVRALFPARFDLWQRIVQRETGDELERSGHGERALDGPDAATAVVGGLAKRIRFGVPEPERAPRLPPPDRSSTIALTRIFHRGGLESGENTLPAPVRTEVSGAVKAAPQPVPVEKPAPEGRAPWRPSTSVGLVLAVGVSCLLIAGGIIAIRGRTVVTTAPKAKARAPIASLLAPPAKPVHQLIVVPKPGRPPAPVAAIPPAPVAAVPPALVADVPPAPVRQTAPATRRPQARRTAGRAATFAVSPPPPSPSASSPSPPPSPSIMNELEPSPYQRSRTTR